MFSVIALLMSLMLGFASCQAEAGEEGQTSDIASGKAGNASVSGTVTYRERLALTEGATLKVELRDTSLADAAAPLIASQTISGPGQVPIPFRVEYNKGDIDPRNTYSISASIIESDGRLAFTNDTAYEVITRGNPNRIDMVLVLVQPPPNLVDEVEDGPSDWRTWVEVPARVVSANLIPNESDLFLRLVFLQSTVEGCARPGNTRGGVDGDVIWVDLTLMQPPETPWAIDCDEEMVELDEVFPIRAQLWPRTTYRVVVNGVQTTTFTQPDLELGHIYIAESVIQHAEVQEVSGEPGNHQLRVVSGRPSGSCTQYNGYELQRHQSGEIVVLITHHQVADPEVIYTKDFPIDETLVPLGPDFQPGDEQLATLNGKPLSTFSSK